MKDSREWFLSIPPVQANTVGTSRGVPAANELPMEGDSICIAKPGMSGQDINKCITGKQALVLTPSLYIADEPINITRPGFVVLGLGYATVLARNGQSCLTVQASATSSRIAGVMCDASQGHDGSPPTQPLFHVKADNAILNDVYVRAGTWGGNVGQPTSDIMALRADVLLSIEGNGVVVDHVWAWVADHSTDKDDGCGVAAGGWDVAALPYIKERVTVVNHGVVVDGHDVIAYCLMAEHTRAHTVVWNGDRGSTYMFQNELPYSGQKAGVRTWGPDQRAYKVTGAQHKGYGLGAYVVVPNWEGDFNPMPNGEATMHFFFEAPGDAKFDRLLGWNNAPGGYRTFLGDAVLLKDGQVFGRNCQNCASSDLCWSSPMKPWGFCHLMDV
jgi:hypothetical protein